MKNLIFFFALFTISLRSYAHRSWHAWAVVDFGGMSIGYKGLVYASETQQTTKLTCLKIQKF